jgi:hypothetical protein
MRKRLAPALWFLGFSGVFMIVGLSPFALPLRSTLETKIEMWFLAFTGDTTPLDEPSMPLFYSVIGQYDEKIVDFQYSLEVMECPDEDCARRSTDELAQKGFEDIFYIKTMSNEQATYSVRKGLFKTQEGAEVARHELNTTHRITSRIVVF